MLMTFSISSPAAIGTIDEGAKTISVTVPYRTDISSLIATFITTGKNMTTNNTPQVSGTTPNNFTNPVIYTVIAVDTVHNEIFVASLTGQIGVFGRTDNGTVAPSGTITSVLQFMGIAVDSEHDEIFVVNYSPASITVYGRTDTGDQAPARTISGPSTDISNPYGIALW